MHFRAIETLTLLAALTTGCNPCVRATHHAEEDAWVDIKDCAEWGSSFSSFDNKKAEYEECYLQAYDLTYEEHFWDRCGYE